ncbi:hypothetical protein BDN72DRAFT_744169, partial [Pluteus cervinus]
RTVYSILENCVFTFIACVYKAIHPNILSANTPKYLRIWDKVVVTFYAIFFSEFVMMWAVGQWFGARPINFKWTVVHGHFLQMGGFGRHHRDDDQKFAISAEDLVDLCAKNLIDLEELRIAESDLQDHSKGDWFSKLVAALQILWFITQCIVRRVEGLYVTHLEVTTLAFAVLSIITYLVWLDKPLNV